MYKRLALFIIILIVMTACQANNEDDTKTENDTTNEHEEVADLPQTNLQISDEGEDVSTLQHYLQEIGYDIDETGTFNNETLSVLTDIQRQNEELNVTGLYDEKTAQFIDDILNEKETIENDEWSSQTNHDTYADEDDVLTNPYNVLALVNKQYALPGDYEPEDLVVPDVAFPFTENLPKKQLRRVAAEALEELFAATEAEGLELFAQSGYRSYDRQVEIFDANVAEHGEERANQFSARPGQSEHQTGLTMDVTSREVDFLLEEEFGETAEGKWLEENAHEFGFIIRYPKGKEDITKYDYEPWHLRYVGEQAAREIAQDELTLEQYLTID